MDDEPPDSQAIYCLLGCEVDAFVAPQKYLAVPSLTVLTRAISSEMTNAAAIRANMTVNVFSPARSLIRRADASDIVASLRDDEQITRMKIMPRELEVLRLLPTWPPASAPSRRGQENAVPGAWLLKELPEATAKCVGAPHRRVLTADLIASIISAFHRAAEGNRSLLVEVLHFKGDEEKNIYIKIIQQATEDIIKTRGQLAAAHTGTESISPALIFCTRTIGENSSLLTSDTQPDCITSAIIQRLNQQPTIVPRKNMRVLIIADTDAEARKQDAWAKREKLILASEVARKEILFTSDPEPRSAIGAREDWAYRIICQAASEVDWNPLNELLQHVRQLHGWEPPDGFTFEHKMGFPKRDASSRVSTETKKPDVILKQLKNCRATNFPPLLALYEQIQKDCSIIQKAQLLWFVVVGEHHRQDLQMWLQRKRWESEHQNPRCKLTLLLWSTARMWAAEKRIPSWRGSEYAQRDDCIPVHAIVDDCSDPRERVWSAKAAIAPPGGGARLQSGVRRGVFGASRVCWQSYSTNYPADLQKRLPPLEAIGEAFARLSDKLGKDYNPELIILGGVVAQNFHALLPSRIDCTRVTLARAVAPKCGNIGLSSLSMSEATRIRLFSMSGLGRDRLLHFADQNPAPDNIKADVKFSIAERQKAGTSCGGQTMLEPPLHWLNRERRPGEIYSEDERIAASFAAAIWDFGSHSSEVLAECEWLRSLRAFHYVSCLRAGARFAVEVPGHGIAIRFLEGMLAQAARVQEEPMIQHLRCRPVWASSFPRRIIEIFVVNTVAPLCPTTLHARAMIRLLRFIEPAMCALADGESGQRHKTARCADKLRLWLVGASQNDFENEEKLLREEEPAVAALLPEHPLRDMLKDPVLTACSACAAFQRSQGRMCFMLRRVITAAALWTSLGERLADSDAQYRLFRKALSSLKVSCTRPASWTLRSLTNWVCSHPRQSGASLPVQQLANDFHTYPNLRRALKSCRAPAITNYCHWEAPTLRTRDFLRAFRQTHLRQQRLAVQVRTVRDYAERESKTEFIALTTRVNQDISSRCTLEVLQMLFSGNPEVVSDRLCAVSTVCYLQEHKEDLSAFLYSVELAATDGAKEASRSARALRSRFTSAVQERTESESNAAAHECRRQAREWNEAVRLRSSDGRPCPRGATDGLTQRIKGRLAKCWRAAGEIAPPASCWHRMLRACAASDAWFGSWRTLVEELPHSHEAQRQVQELARYLLLFPSDSRHGAQMGRKTPQLPARLNWKPNLKEGGLGFAAPSDLDQVFGKTVGEKLGLGNLPTVMKRLVQNRRITAWIHADLRAPLPDGLPSNLSIAQCPNQCYALEPITESVELAAYALPCLAPEDLTTGSALNAAWRRLNIPVPEAATVALHRHYFPPGKDNGLWQAYDRAEATPELLRAMRLTLARGAKGSVQEKLWAHADDRPEDLRAAMPPPEPLLPSPIWCEMPAHKPHPAEPKNLSSTNTPNKRREWTNLRGPLHWSREQIAIRWQMQGARYCHGRQDLLVPRRTLNRRRYVEENGFKMTAWDDAGKAPDIFEEQLENPVVFVRRSCARKIFGGRGVTTPSLFARHVGDLGSCVLSRAEQARCHEYYLQHGLRFVAINAVQMSLSLRFVAMAATAHILGRWKYFPLFARSSYGYWPRANGAASIQRLVHAQLSARAEDPEADARKIAELALRVSNVNACPVQLLAATPTLRAEAAKVPTRSRDQEILKARRLIDQLRQRWATATKATQEPPLWQYSYDLIDATASERIRHLAEAAAQWRLCVPRDSRALPMHALLCKSLEKIDVFHSKIAQAQELVVPPLPVLRKLWANLHGDAAPCPTLRNLQDAIQALRATALKLNVDQVFVSQLHVPRDALRVEQIMSLPAANRIFLSNQTLRQIAEVWPSGRVVPRSILSWDNDSQLRNALQNQEWRCVDRDCLACALQRPSEPVAPPPRNRAGACSIIIPCFGRRALWVRSLVNNEGRGRRDADPWRLRAIGNHPPKKAVWADLWKRVRQDLHARAESSLTMRVVIRHYRLAKGLGGCVEGGRNGERIDREQQSLRVRLQTKTENFEILDDIGDAGSRRPQTATIQYSERQIKRIRSAAPNAVAGAISLHGVRESGQTHDVSVAFRQEYRRNVGCCAERASDQIRSYEIAEWKTRREMEEPRWAVDAKYCWSWLRGSFAHEGAKTDLPVLVILLTLHEKEMQINKYGMQTLSHWFPAVALAPSGVRRPSYNVVVACLQRFIRDLARQQEDRHILVVGVGESFNTDDWGQRIAKLSAQKSGAYLFADEQPEGTFACPVCNAQPNLHDVDATFAVNGHGCCEACGKRFCALCGASLANNPTGVLHSEVCSATSKIRSLVAPMLVHWAPLKAIPRDCADPRLAAAWCWFRRVCRLAEVHSAARVNDAKGDRAQQKRLLPVESKKEGSFPVQKKPRRIFSADTITPAMHLWDDDCSETTAELPDEPLLSSHLNNTDLQQCRIWTSRAARFIATYRTDYHNAIHDGILLEGVHRPLSKFKLILYAAHAVAIDAPSEKYALVYYAFLDAALLDSRCPCGVDRILSKMDSDSIDLTTLRLLAEQEFHAFV